MGNLALHCNPAGRIVRVICDDDGVLSQRPEGRMLSATVISSGVAHVFELLGHLEEHPVVCGWMLEFGSVDEPRVYHCAAARDEEIVLVAGTDAPLDAAALGAFLPGAIGPGDHARLHALATRMGERLGDSRALIHDMRCQVAALQYQTKSPIKLENELVRVAAHDLRNPLLVVSMNCSFLHHDCEQLNDDQRALLTDTLDTCEYMTRYLDGMTSLAEVWVGELKLDSEATELHELVRFASERNARIARQRMIHISLDRVEPLTLDVDPKRIGHVLDQLFSNVLKFCPANTRARVELFQKDGHAVIRIEDTGPGMSKDVQQKLFKPFGKTHADTTLPGDYGAGVGLAIAGRLVEAHGGRMEVQAEEGQGTRVTILLPL